MYVGIGIEQGKQIHEEDAFMYAMERCTTDCADDFVKEFAGRIHLITVSDMRNLRESVVEWFYSGNWVRREESA